MQPGLSSANVTIVKMNFSSSVSMLAPELNQFLRSKPLCVFTSQRMGLGFRVVCLHPKP